MSNIKSRLLAGVLAVVTAATPTASYASVIDIDNDVVSISTATDKETSSKFLFITLKTKGGSVILNKDTVDQQVIKLDYHNVKVDESGKTEKKLFIEVYDKDEILLFSEEAEKNKNTYMYEVEADKVVTIDAVADEGYGITGFEGTEGEVEDKLGEELRPSFTYPVFMDEDAKVSVKFGEIPKEETPPVEAETDEKTREEDLTVEQPEAAEGEDSVEENCDDEAEADNDLTVSEGNESEAEDDLTVSEGENVEGEADLTVSESEADEVEDNESDEDLTMDSSEDSNNLLEEPNTDNDLSIEDNSDELIISDNDKQEHFLEFSEGIYSLDSEQFETARLLVLADNMDDIIDTEHLIANYNDLYLLQYNSAEQAMNAYLYYDSQALAVEPDASVKVAGEKSGDGSFEDIITADVNPLIKLSEADMFNVSLGSKVIALIDTGVSDGPNIINRISMIDDDTEGTNPHGNQMVDAIVSQNPDAQILSIRALGDDGFGNISSVVAAMEYAIEQNVDIINLSMTTKSTLFNSMINAKVQEAENKGIVVVGAAGNDNADVQGYVPGRIGRPYIIGAANTDGTKQVESNYGATVDYNVVADSTSEAAAKFTGYISANGTDAIDTKNHIIYETDYIPELGTADIPEMKVYYLCYRNEDVEDVIDNFILKYPVEILDDGTIRSYINPTPEWVDYNNTYDETGEPLDVDINRGVMGGWQIPITEECVYNEKEGYIDIPGKYAGQDLTVTVWQSVDSLFYRNAVPDEWKPDDLKGRQVSLYSYYDDWRGSFDDVHFGAKGCNTNVKIDGSIDDIKTGEVYTFNASSYTHYIGQGNESWSWDSVPGAGAYAGAQAFGQVTSISGCSNPIFNNIGAPGPLGKNYLFGGCISDVNNNFAGQPHVASGYIECLSIDKAKGTAVFYLHVDCVGANWSDRAQNVGAKFTVQFPQKGSIEIDKYIGQSSVTGSGNFADDNPLVKLNCTFTVYSDSQCTTKVKSVSFDSTSLREQKQITNLDPGTYYIKETRKCDGCAMPVNSKGVHNVYKCTVKAGEVTKSFVDVDSKETVTKFKNNPYYFKGKLIGKVDENNKPLEGAVFKVQYSPAKEGDPDYKVTYTWYMKSDKKGEVKFDADHVLSTWNGKKSSKALKLSNDSWALLQGYYYITEVQAPEGYEIDKTKHTVRLNCKKNENEIYADYAYTIENPAIVKDKKTEEPNWKIAVNAKKVSAANKKGLAGAKFQLYWDKDCTIKVDEDEGILESTADGTTNTIVIKLKTSEYPDSVTIYCRETEAPEGYIPTDEVFALKFEKKKFDELNPGLTVDTPDKDIKYETKTFGPNGVIENEEGSSGWKVAVETKKVSAGDKKGLKGAEFTVYKDEECTKPIGTLTSKDDGTTNVFVYTVSLKEYPDKITLYCKETTPPPGYKLNPTKFKVTFNYSDFQALNPNLTPDTPESEIKYETKAFGVDGVIENEANGPSWKVALYAMKIAAETKVPLEGAVFDIFLDKDCNQKIGSIESGPDGLTPDFVYDVSIEDFPESITLYVKEANAPDGYLPIDEVFEVKFNKKDFDALNPGLTASTPKEDIKYERKPVSNANGIENVTPTPGPSTTPTPPPEGSGPGLYIKKTSTVDPEILELNGYSLAGGVFEVTSDRSDSGTLTTGEDGISDTMPLTDYSWEEPHEAVLGPNDEVITEAWVEVHHVTTNYTIRETKPPKGHQMNYTPEHQRVITPDDNGKTFEIKFEDEPIFCKNKLDIEKLGSKGNPIEGVVFKVELFDSPSGESGTPVRTWYLESDKNGKIYLDDAHITHRLDFQSDPFFMHKGQIVIPIDCYLKFTEVAAPAEYIINDKPFGLPTGEDAELSYRAYNEPQPCEVKIKKYEADGSTPITGVEFEIKFLEEAIHANGNKHPNFKRLLEVGQTYVAHTDENGELVFKNLDQGKYEITEIKTETGHGLLKDPIIVTLPLTMTESEAYSYGKNIDYTTAIKDESYTDKWFFYGCLYEVTNNANLKMPMSGGLGDWKYGFIGMGVIAMIGTSLIVHESLNKKRRKTHKRKKQNIDDFKI